MAGNGRISIKRMFREKEITADVQLLDEGISVLLSGGDLSHIGAVYVRDNQNGVTRYSFEGHKDYVLAEEWMQKLKDLCNVPVVVMAGIHYDHILLTEIEDIQALSQDMLREVCLWIEGKNSDMEVSI